MKLANHSSPPEGRNDRSCKWEKTIYTKYLTVPQVHQYIEYNELKFRCSVYRPFTKQFLYFDHPLIERRYQLSHIFPAPAIERENRVVMCSSVASEKPFYAMMTKIIPNLSFVGFGSPCQCFPFYTYKEDGTNRRENITAWSLQQFHVHYKNDSITKWDIFYYIYGLLHHTEYRKSFKDCLRRDLPRIPFAPEFQPFAKAGEKLTKLHLEYESVEPYDLKWVETPDTRLDYRVEKMKLNKEKTSCNCQ